ncbi:MAG: V-type ATP synthase subunit D [Gammaproteobacteria bacterium]
MPRLALNKASLMRESKRLRTFERFLPSLDLKRRQLVTERRKAAHLLSSTRQQIDSLERKVADELPMLANHRKLRNVVRIAGIEWNEENLLGVRLPRLSRVVLDTSDYPLLASAQWLDKLSKHLSLGLELHVRLQVETARAARLEQAVRKVTQRVNLFEKVLIPKTRANIKQISIYLSDAERAAVVRAKIARSKVVREKSL